MSFLQEVNELFPVPLTEKVDLGEYANKLLCFATLVPSFEGDMLIGLVAGYTDRLSEDGRAYIALVAVRKGFQRRGIAQNLVESFLDICRQKGIEGVHLYTDCSNASAIRMYQRIGFDRIMEPGDPRPKDAHFSIRLGEPTLRRLKTKTRRSECALVTAIGSFSTNAVLSGIWQAGYRAIGCDIYPAQWLASSLDVDRFYQVPPVASKGAYIEALLEICRREGVTRIIPLTDPEVDALSADRIVFEDVGVQVLVSPKEVISLCRDKAKFAEFVSSANFGELPKVIPTARVVDTAPYPYPVICKPFNGRSSQGLKFIRSDSEWSAFCSEEGKSSYIVQPFIEGRVITVDVVRHPDSDQVVSIPRVELLRTSNGAGTSVYVFADSLLSEVCGNLARSLGIVGCVNFEFLLDERHDYHLLECNPRFSGGVAFSCETGYDVIGNHLRCFRDSENQIDALPEYKPRYIARRYAEWTTSVEKPGPYSKLDE
ncbi:ATP-grasp domain-containing protein [Gordonibacter massiliensis]|uniref:ATP-grasp domain-containing protein n=1 Tax=Gordonibacter massiliensis (ex Traore et al. 2017) TaxID=1841863 RepID=A0A842JFV8_9ACTN|nr:ATP-grasp domain-containing protein [Gordonibacter massiliensis (ex Traore et al. 2017)]